MKYEEARQIIQETENKVIYITKDINLQGNTLTVGQGNVLIFLGGSINGVLIGQGNIVLGDVNITEMRGDWYDYGVSYPKTNLTIGRCFFNINVGKPAWWTGDTTDGKSGWVDATGTPVLIT